MSDQTFRRVARPNHMSTDHEADEKGRRLISAKKKFLLADPPHHGSEGIGLENGSENGDSPVERRRQIDPTTCERDYSNDEIEFMKAMDDYKRRNARPFPTWSEVLEVIRSLGYSRTPPTTVPTIEPT